ncbi:NPC intracellular cholesterol transporter 1-like [Panulirus ornatus]|uniref:NPC intracellular cholesterol transporter 1-like n=1 Tax=Panulirus ornatus TaxID=150431 RepID=UPI003A846D6B
MTRTQGKSTRTCDLEAGPGTTRTEKESTRTCDLEAGPGTTRTEKESTRTCDLEAGPGTTRTEKESTRTCDLEAGPGTTGTEKESTRSCDLEAGPGTTGTEKESTRTCDLEAGPGTTRTEMESTRSCDLEAGPGTTRTEKESTRSCDLEAGPGTTGTEKERIRTCDLEAGPGTTTTEEESTRTCDLEAGPGTTRTFEESVQGNNHLWSWLCERLRGCMMTMNVEEWCYHWGHLSTRSPTRTILMALLMVVILSLGLLHLQPELRPYRLWLPQTSSFTKVDKWRGEHWCPRDKSERQQVVVWEGEDNILTAQAIQAMWHLHQRVANLNGGTWNHVCARLPLLPTPWAAAESWWSGAPRGKRRLPLRDYLALGMAYCQTLATSPRLCQEHSLLEVWGYDPQVILSLTDERVLHDVNRASVSHVYGGPLPVRQLLGGVVRDATGRMVGARAALHTWFTTVQANTTTKLDLGTGQPVDLEGLAWEEALVQEVLGAPTPPQITLHVHAGHSFGAVSAATMLADVKWVVCGWVVLALYVLATLGRPLPALMGLVAVALAVAATYGLCSAFGVPYGPITSVLPVLLLGLGVDDMYVVAGAWELASGTGAKRGGHTLRAAGMAITLTTLTDAAAFLVGSATQVPALRWFCVYAAVGVTVIYLLQATVFLAALALDQHHKNAGATTCGVRPEQRSAGLLAQVMQWYATIVVKPTVAVMVMVAAAAMVAGGVWGSTKLRQEFSPLWFLPQSSYLYQWFTAMDRHFPEVGEPGTVYFANVSLPEELPGLRALTMTLRTSPYITSVDAWFSELDTYMENSHSNHNLTLEELLEALATFLHSPVGIHFNSHFVFHEPLTCGAPAPSFSIFKVDFQYRRLRARGLQQAAMNEVQQAVANANLSGYRAVWAHVYSQWETDSHLAGEMWYNLGVVVSIVGVVTVVVVGRGLVTVMMVSCVMATLLEVAALMHAWDLTIDTVTTVALILAVGICVDYATHMAHAFLMGQGERQARAQAAVESMGTPLLHAGISTLVASVALSPSHSHLFLAFFKIFTCVSMLGLFHGLVVLPALLSLVGPQSNTLFILPTVPHPTHTLSTPSTVSHPLSTSSTVPHPIHTLSTTSTVSYHTHTLSTPSTVSHPTHTLSTPSPVPHPLSTPSNPAHTSPYYSNDVLIPHLKQSSVPVFAQSKVTTLEKSLNNIRKQAGKGLNSANRIYNKQHIG